MANAAELKLPQLCTRCANYKHQGFLRPAREGQFRKYGGCGRHTWICNECLAAEKHSNPLSKLERNIETVLKASGVRYRASYRLERCEFDFYFPDHGLLVEIDPVFYHCTRAKRFRAHMKKRVARENGLYLLSLSGDKMNAHTIIEELRKRSAPKPAPPKDLCAHTCPSPELPASPSLPCSIQPAPVRAIVRQPWFEACSL